MCAAKRKSPITDLEAVREERFFSLAVTQLFVVLAAEPTYDVTVEEFRTILGLERGCYRPSSMSNTRGP